MAQRCFVLYERLQRRGFRAIFGHCLQVRLGCDHPVLDGCAWHVVECYAFIKEVDFRPESVFVLSFIGISIAIIVSLKDFNSALPFILNSTLALFWIGFNLSFFYQIYLSFGGAVALLVLTCVWFFDIGAFVVGMKFGKIRISPIYSPKKSLEGVFGGIGFAIAYIFLFEFGASLINIYNNPDGSPRAFFIVNIGFGNSLLRNLWRHIRISIKKIQTCKGFWKYYARTWRFTR